MQFMPPARSNPGVFKRLLNERGIMILAAATPLFKWYSSNNDAEVIHDSFGFNPRLSEKEKLQTITRAIEGEVEGAELVLRTQHAYLRERLEASLSRLAELARRYYGESLTVRVDAPTAQTRKKIGRAHV